EEINANYPQFNGIYSHLAANNSNHLKQTSSTEQEYIVLGDDEYEQQSLPTYKRNSGRMEASIE
ncbi:hypothetical protein, partial [Corallococcus sp. AB038B]|uniref:hypothetical protein n=1 Tax=Corallococcus sp. AB038B TaxID=2316718 RepID=UPI001F471BDB